MARAPLTWKFSPNLRAPRLFHPHQCHAISSSKARGKWRHVYVNCIFVTVGRNPHTSHLVYDTFDKSPRGASHIFASCLGVVFAAVLLVRAFFVARTNKKVLHSSHLLALRRSPTKSVTPWLPTYLVLLSTCLCILAVIVTSITVELVDGQQVCESSLDVSTEFLGVSSRVDTQATIAPRYAASVRRRTSDTLSHLLVTNTHLELLQETLAIPILSNTSA